MSNLFHYFTPFLEIITITILINYVLFFFWNHRSLDLAWGVLVFLLLFAVAYSFKMPVLVKIMQGIGGVAIFGILVIFQPELRLALSKMSWRGRKYREITEFDRFLDQLANSTYRLAEKRVGALIVLENEDSLEEYVQRSVVLNADFSSELVETIFCVGTPLHDGSVIVRNRTLLGASAILPLAEEGSQLTKSMGTRHRAALGLSNICDALIIVVSEETGKVAIVREGIMTRGIKSDRFKGIIRSVFNPPAKLPFKKRFNLFEWLAE